MSKISAIFSNNSSSNWISEAFTLLNTCDSLDAPVIADLTSGASIILVAGSSYLLSLELKFVLNRPKPPQKESNT